MLNSKSMKNTSLRNNEYYCIQNKFDTLYKNSLNNAKFKNLMNLITSEENIMLAYRNIKNNKGSFTSGASKETIKDIEILEREDFIKTVKNKLRDYKPKAVRRVEIPKPNGKIRPLGIPDIWDRIIQQCIFQVLEPICEPKFHERSNGFRPNRSTENAIAQCARMINKQHLYHVVDIDITGFFDNVNHNKLIRQMWNLGIRDKELICIIKKILKAPIQMPNGEIVHPNKGTPQGGILSPLLSNICLNELDWWIASQWETIKTRNDYKNKVHANGTVDRSNTFKLLRKSTKLKEMFIVRYADDFKIFCKNKEDAVKIFEATKKWLDERLGLQVSDEKSLITDLRKKYSEFLGFKIKAVKKGKTYVMESHISDKSVKRIKDTLKSAIIYIQGSKDKNTIYTRVNAYNYKVWGIHNYYEIATHVSEDVRLIAYEINKCMGIRLRHNLKKTGTLKDSYIKEKYGKSKSLRYIFEQPITPISYVKHRKPMYKRKIINKYTVEGREEIHKNLGIDMNIMKLLMEQDKVSRSIEYTDNRISLYSAQHGRCAITKEPLYYTEIHCHHKIPKHLGGTDEYKNLIVVHEDIHTLIHAKEKDAIENYKRKFNLDRNMVRKINRLRKMCTNEELVI